MFTKGDTITMFKPSGSYCRFCAQLKSSEKLINFDEDLELCKETMLKLTHLNAKYVYVTLNEKALPRAACLPCMDSLTKADEFLIKLKKSQEVLSVIFCIQNEDDGALTDYYNAPADQYEPPDSPEDDIPLTSLEKSEKEYGDEIALKNDIKIEVKDEDLTIDDATAIEENVHNQILNESLNVQDIIDAALSNTLGSNVAFYEKDISDIGDINILSWKDYPWICFYCNIEFQGLETLRSHLKLVHSRCCGFTCVDCKNFFKNDNFNSFIKHVKKHRKSLKKRCHYCDEEIDKSLTIKKHVKEHFKKSKVACNFCGEITDNEVALQRHLADNTKPKRKPRRKNGLPVTIEELTCNICHKVYKTLNSLRDHVKRHISDRQRNYTCDRCGKAFFNKGTLTSHIMAHDKIKPHKCKICNKSFLFPNMLRRHVQMHSGDKPFSCEQCGRCFRLQYQLVSHKIIHTDNMPYVCSYCNKAFRFKQILKNHERQHTGAKPYACQICIMEFTNWSNYNKHMKRRHGMDTSKKKITPEGVFPVNPETGQIIQNEDPVGTEEWKSKIMIPAKRGKKKVIKQEAVQQHS